MRTTAIVVGSMMVAASLAASAQTYNYHVFKVADQARECWNQGAGHFEAVRPGERQNDLDFNKCRYIGESPRDMARWGSGHQECWNPRAGHYEGVRKGEQQNDLDFSRCRNSRDN